jgi:hypothetical protein
MIENNLMSNRLRMALIEGKQSIRDKKGMCLVQISKASQERLRPAVGNPLKVSNAVAASAMHLGIK